MERLNKEVIEIRKDAQADQLLDPEASPDNVIPLAAGLVARCTEQRASADRVNKYQRLFK